MWTFTDRARETFVVFMLVARVVCALQSAVDNVSLSREKWGLLLLSAVAGAVDSGIFRSSLQTLKPRLDPSSGVLLGALTLPIEFAARAVQSLRNSSSEFAGVETLKFQFWIATCCSFRLALCSADISWKRTQKKENLITKRIGDWRCTCPPTVDVELLLCLATFLLSSLLPRPQSGLGVFGFGWILLLSAACKFVFMYVLETFPGCATPGEALLVAEGLVLYLGNASAYALSKVGRFKRLLNHGYGVGDGRLDVVNALLQALTLGLLLVPWLFRVLVSVVTLGLDTPRTRSAAIGSPQTTYAGNSVLFVIALAVIFMIFVPMWFGAVTGHQQHLLHWIFNFILEEFWQRFVLCLFWGVTLIASISLILRVAKRGKVATIIVRKYYHVLAVVLFTPGLLLQPDFLRLAFGVAFAGFVVVEMVRVWRLPPIGEWVHQFMKGFTDNRDSDLLIISHFSLLVGCALPLWLNKSGDFCLAPYAGILSLGIGDTMASLVGVNYGRIQLSKTNRKTIEGTMGGIVSMLLACSLLSCLLMQSITTRQLWSMIGAVTGAALLEAFTTQLDNAFVPLVLHALLLL